MSEEAKKPAKKEMQRGLVPRNKIDSALAVGWVPVKGTGADGFLWHNGDLVMEMPKENYTELCKRRSEPSRRLQETLRSGRPMASVPEGMTATASVEEQRPRN